MTTNAADAPQARSARREVLSLALMDARNHTLRLLTAFEQAGAAAGALAVAGHIGWFNENWIARNPQRALGAACPADGVRLASIEPNADGWFNPALASEVQAPPLVAEAVKAYLLDTHETTLDLLEKAGEDDASLYFFRVALWHEDLRGEQLVELAQALGVPLAFELPAGAAVREPIGLPATRWSLGWAEPGFAPAIERGSSSVAVPEFEIDAQPVNWAQYVEFIADGGYDRPELWLPEGWQWLEEQARLEGRRGPRHVEQIGVASGAVLQTWFGKARRMGSAQSVVHASWWEADAYARWAGRRLATEEEWEIAAVTAARRGLRWGDVREWTAGTLQPLDGYRPDPWARDARLDPQPVFGQARVVRGASFATRARLRHPKARGWALPQEDGGFVGFRTCAWV